MFFLSLSRSLRVLLVVGVTTFLVGVIGLFSLEFIVDHMIRTSVALRNGTETYKQFVSPSVPARMQFYIWDLLNVHEVLNGDRPFLVERGPFTYAEVRVKFDIKYDSNKDYITYKQNRTFIFLRNESIGDDSTVFTSVNLPLITILNTLKYQPSFIRSILADILATYPNETLFTRKSVREVTFGYTDPILTLAKRFLPKIVYTDYIGVMAGLNNTFDGVYTINAGNIDSVHLGEIQTFNGSKYLHFWSSELANTVYGSDGTLAPPFLNKTAKLPCFISDICRSLYGIYDGDVKVAGGITAWQFSGPDFLLANATLNPSNAGYCTPAGNCLPTGLVNITSCKILDGLHLPIIVSLPHFLVCDADILDSVIGMRPDNVSHRTFVNIEPLSGVVVQVFKRLQINVYMEHVKEFAHIGNVKTMYYPVLWMNESAVLDEETAGKLNSLLFTPRYIAYTSLISLTVFGAVLSSFFIVATVCIYSQHSSPQTPAPATNNVNMTTDRDDALLVDNAENNDGACIQSEASVTPSQSSLVTA